ncbi:MAG TPA: sugar phosphate isomerase/epimerase [Acidimicrobiaceae bacterium]|nr:TIM barrel protein [Actinomycetota bacterium]MED5583309.1 TIM barrel protein [Actinomycetota bacterium]HBM56411.1 sugar phosphate isomerase/epimerase [Acidimicrobiaceae bacterium]
MTDPADLGICLATLLPDPFNADAAAILSTLDAAARHGFGGVSAWSLHVMNLDPDPRVFNRAVRDRGLEVRVVEAATGWAASDGIDRDGDFTLDMAGELGAHQIVAVTLEAAFADGGRAVAGFADLCDRAAERHIRVALEFLPWSAVPDLASASALTAAAGRPNGGILLDTWHWQRQPGGPCPEVLEGLPAGAIQVVQLCDASAEPGVDPMGEAMASRPLPGEGVVDFIALASALEGIGATPLLCPEVFNAGLLAAGPSTFAGSVADACRSAWPSGRHPGPPDGGH